VEPAWPQGDEGTEEYPHPRSGDWHSKEKDTDAEKNITKQNQPVLVSFREAYVPMSHRPKVQSFPSFQNV